MKLLTKTLFFYIGSSLLVFFLGGYIFLEVLRHTFYEQVDRDLLTEKNIIEEEISHNSEIPDYTTRFGHEIEVILYRHPILKNFALKDTTIEDTVTHKNQYYRYLRVDNNNGRRGYSISFLQPFSGRYILFRSIINMILFMFLGIMMFSIIINYIISRRLWRPFYETIQQLSHYSIRQKPLMNFPNTGIQEFEKLNEVLSTMSLKIRQDFFNLKEFTEDASHEIQTPLAIIKSKLELLVQTENLSSEQAKLINEIDQAITRLSKLNSGLLLLAKIENNQYSEKQQINLKTYIHKSLEIYEDFISHKNLQITREYYDTPVFQMNPTLAEILTNNLVSNAIRHNYVNGFIQIKMTSSSLVITNSGEPCFENPEVLFNRFKKSGKNSDSIGLGLAIVKKICTYYDMNISYYHKDTNHTITVNFNS